MVLITAAKRSERMTTGIIDCDSQATSHNDGKGWRDGDYDDDIGKVVHSASLSSYFAT